MELWSTSDPSQIASFLQQLQTNNHNLDDMSQYNMNGWTDKKEGDYTIDTDKKALYYTEGSVNGRGEAVITGRHINLGSESAGFLDATMNAFGKINDISGGSATGLATNTYRRVAIATALDAQINGNIRMMNQVEWLSKSYKLASKISKASPWVAGGISVGGVFIGYQKDGHKFGYNTQKAALSGGLGIAGGWAGAEIGAAAGASIGAWFGGFGALPGGIIGGVIGGIGGSIGGEAAGEEIIDATR